MPELDEALRVVRRFSGGSPAAANDRLRLMGLLAVVLARARRTAAR